MFALLWSPSGLCAQAGPQGQGQPRNMRPWMRDHPPSSQASLCHGLLLTGSELLKQGMKGP